MGEGHITHRVANGILIVFVITPAIVFSIVEFQPITINLSDPIWIPAVLTIAGTYGLHVRKERKRKNRLETAFQTELKQLSHLDKLPTRFKELEKPPTKEKIPKDTVPAADSLPTKVYESNISDISRLDPELTERLVDFYSLLIRHKATIREIHQDHPEDESDNLPMADHKDLYEDAEELSEKRTNLINKIES